jgi:murein L,D-transpeptidase YcbB/YkuD
VNKILFPALVFWGLAGAVLAATPAKPHKKHHTAGTAAHATTKKSAKTVASGKVAVSGKSKTGATLTARRKGKPTAHKPTRSYQQAPSPERYQEIQQALATKGFYQGQANGEWGPDSVDALKRFQASQNLMPDGKISSLSLIALGLGPKRLTAKSDSATPAQPGTSAPTPAAPAQ